MASLNAPIQAKKTENCLNTPPYAATSAGNQKATSKNPKLLSGGDQGSPNLAAPKSAVRR